MPVICFQFIASLNQKYDTKNSPTIVNEKKIALPVFNEMVFNASVKHTEFKNPKIKLAKRMVQYFTGFFSAFDAYLNQIFVKILKKISSKRLYLEITIFFFFLFIKYTL